MTSILSRFTRRKIVERGETTTALKRVLTTMDLTLLGIGSTLGIGIYVLAGSVAKKDAGPAVIISFLVAALASVLAGLCYAEFGARVPKAGSAYVYSYVCVGELIAFIVGWNLIMEYVIGVASVAKGYSGYVDSLCHSSMKTAFTEYFPIHVSFLSAYVDFFAFGITVMVTLVLAFGVKESTFFNNIFTGLNLLVVAFVVVAGSIFANPENWKISEHTNFTAAISRSHVAPGKIGQGGFAPFGFAGIMKGAATCFYGFVGFDCIATTGEEAKNPQRSIPLAIIFSLFFIFIAYFGISTVITMMVPYYLQDADAPLPEAFMYVHFPTGKWIVTVGAIFGLSTSLLGSMFPMPRVIYAMASDGLLFKFLSKVHPRFQTPLIATLIAGVFGGMMAAFFDLDALMDMMSIGTLTAYTLVAVCVLVLRYRKDEEGADDLSITSGSPPAVETEKFTFGDYIGQSVNRIRANVPTKLSSSYSGLAVFLFCLSSLGLCSTAVFAADRIFHKETGYIILFFMWALLCVFILVSLQLQPVSRVQLSFKVPLVPLVPGLSIVFNIYLIMNLTGPTWIRFAVWMLIGFIIYAYCIWSGAADKAYAISLDDANSNKRKYSKVSVTSFQPGLPVTFKGDKLSNGLPKLPESPEDDAESGLPAPSGSQRESSNVTRMTVTTAHEPDPLTSLELVLGTGVYSATKLPCPPDDERDGGDFVARMDLADEDTESERSRESLQATAQDLVSLTLSQAIQDARLGKKPVEGPVQEPISLKDMCEKVLKTEELLSSPQAAKLQRSKEVAAIYSSLNDLDKILRSADLEAGSGSEYGGEYDYDMRSYNGPNLLSTDSEDEPKDCESLIFDGSELNSFEESSAKVPLESNNKAQRKIGVVEGVIMKDDTTPERQQPELKLPVEPGKAC